MSSTDFDSIEEFYYLEEFSSCCDDSISLSYTSDDELERLFELESNDFVIIEHVKRRLAKVQSCKKPINNF